MYDESFEQGCIPSFLTDWVGQHGAPPDTFGQLVAFVRSYYTQPHAHVGAFHVVPWVWPFATGLFGGIIADQKFGHLLR